MDTTFDANSTPMVVLDYRLNSFLVNLEMMFDLPTPESPTSTIFSWKSDSSFFLFAMKLNIKIIKINTQGRQKSLVVYHNHFLNSWKKDRPAPKPAPQKTILCLRIKKSDPMSPRANPWVAQLTVPRRNLLRRQSASRMSWVEQGRISAETPSLSPLILYYYQSIHISSTNNHIPTFYSTYIFAPQSRNSLSNTFKHFGHFYRQTAFLGQRTSKQTLQTLKSSVKKWEGQHILHYRLKLTFLFSSSWNKLLVDLLMENTERKVRIMSSSFTSLAIPPVVYDT